MVGQLPDLFRSVDVKLRFFRVALQETLDQDESTRVYWLVFIHLSAIPTKYTARAIGIINDAIGTAARNVTDCQDWAGEED